MTTAYTGHADHQTDTGALADTLLALRDEADIKPINVEPGLYLVPLVDGGFEVADIRDQLNANQERPSHLGRQITVRDVASLTSYLAKHGLPETEIVAYIDDHDITATIDAPTAANGDTHSLPGWGRHLCCLSLRATPDWAEWLANDNKMLSQAEFADFVEMHLPNFRNPAAADMLELAQSIRVSTGGRFESTKRVKTGETTLTYVEEHDAKAGTKGDLAIPDEFELALQPYQTGQTFKVIARFRSRIHGGQLLLGYRLLRIQDVHTAAFEAICDDVAKATGRTIWQA